MINRTITNDLIFAINCLMDEYCWHTEEETNALPGWLIERIEFLCDAAIEAGIVLHENCAPSSFLG